MQAIHIVLYFLQLNFLFIRWVCSNFFFFIFIYWIVWTLLSSMFGFRKLISFWFKFYIDRLLTPPETPLYPSAVARENPLSSPAPPARESPLPSTSFRGRAAARSVSNTRPSRVCIIVLISYRLFSPRSAVILFLF